MTANDKQYLDTLRMLLDECRTEGSQHATGSRVVAEICGYMKEFSPDGHITGTNEKYVKHELEWYLSEDLRIKGHAGIGSNKVWQQCATEDGHVNSNYGWCLFSQENGMQFSHALEELHNNPKSRQAVMIYTRPSIHKEKDDYIHARYDMLCTMYTQLLVRDGKLNMHVHMRSNDVWTGLRNDLAWQQYVYSMALEKLDTLFFPRLKKGRILWMADSLHMYERNLKDCEKWLSDMDKEQADA